MNRFFLFFILLFVFLVVQLTFLSRFSFFQVKPDLIFVFLILWAARCGPLEGAIFGMLVGLLVDSFGYGVPLYFLSYTIFGVLAGWGSLRFIEGRLFQVVPWVFGFSVVAFLLQYFLLEFFSRGQLSFSFFFLIVSASLNALVAPVLYPVFFVGSKK